MDLRNINTEFDKILSGKTIQVTAFFRINYIPAREVKDKNYVNPLSLIKYLYGRRRDINAAYTLIFTSVNMQSLAKVFTHKNL